MSYLCPKCKTKLIKRLVLIGKPLYCTNCKKEYPLEPEWYTKIMEDRID